MPARLHLGANVRNRQVIQVAWRTLSLRVPLALAHATAGGARFDTWFCPPGAGPVRARVQRNVRTLLQAMNNFLNGPTPYSVTVAMARQSSPNAATYGFVYPDLGRMPHRPGQIYFIYLGTAWNAPLAVPPSPPPSHARDTTVQVLAHELSHHFGTNARSIAGGLYTEEQYDDDALNLPHVSPIYASHNADNYGYYIEEF